MRFDLPDGHDLGPKVEQVVPSATGEAPPLELERDVAQGVDGGLPRPEAARDPGGEQGARRLPRSVYAIPGG